MDEISVPKKSDSPLKDLMKIYEARTEGVFIHDWDDFGILTVNQAALRLNECKTIRQLEEIYCQLPSPYSRKEAP